MKDFWNERYGQEAFAYGTWPNAFFKAFIDNQIPGKILLPAEGEGRNAVYAATKGWQVTAFDFSEAGQKKALKLAAQNQVELTYTVEDATSFLTKEKYDAIALIFAHFPPPVRAVFHSKLKDFLKPGGTLLLEAYHKDQLQNGTGGPKKEEMLFSEEELLTDFKGLTIEFCRQVNLVLEEGKFHQGKSDLVQLMARKE